MAALAKGVQRSADECVSGVILAHAEAVALIKARLSRLQAGVWWTAIYHVEVKGQPDCPANCMSGISPGRCLWDATTQLTEQQQVMDAEWGAPRSMFAVLFREQREWLSTSIQQLWPALWPPTRQNPG